MEVILSNIVPQYIIVVCNWLGKSIQQI